MLDRRYFMRAGGLAAAGLAGASVPAAPALAADAGKIESVIGYNVLDFKAAGDLDDTAAIQAALNEAQGGGIAYLPQGTYRVSKPLYIPPGATLMGTHANHIDESADDDAGNDVWVQTTSKIVPTATFEGDALLMIVNERLLNVRFGAGTYAAGSAGQRLINLTLNGANVKIRSLDAIRFVGKVHGVVVRDVSIYKFTGHAITTSPDDQQSETPAYLYSARFERIAAKASAGITFGFTNTTDSLFTDLLTMEGGNVGFFIVGCGNSTFTSCRAEWNAGNGFDIKGGNGIVELLGCSTDRNTQNGVNIGPTNTTSDMIVLNGLRLRRDGRNGGAGGGGYAGLRIKEAKTPVLVSAIAVDTGKDDDPTSTAVPGPQYGVYIENPTLVVLDSGIVRGTTAGLQPPSASTVKIGTGFVIL